MKLDPAAIGLVIKDEVLKFMLSTKVDESGCVVQVGDGIAQVVGLYHAKSGELLQFENGDQGIAMNLEENSIAVVLLSGGENIHEGDYVTRTGQVVHVPVGDALLGRVVNALGDPLDQKGYILAGGSRPVERIAPGVLARKSVNVPLFTGIKAIDAMAPIGRGQRQLIIGDRQTGKTAIAVDAIMNQKDQNVHCIYVAIGQKNSTIAGIVNKLDEHGAMAYTTIVASGASDPPLMQYLAPYSGCAIAEYWMEQGKDTLIIYDDLSRHSVAYRAISLLMKRPPGREAFPGDIFYLHSRLLERAGRLSEEYGGGSITALPIIETQGGNMSAYIPTNVISITDGQIYLETELFNAGIRPAVNPGLSVSRVGGAAQVKAMKSLASPLRTQLAQYRELASFAQFSSDLDKDTRDRLNYGERIIEILKQPQYKPVSVEHEIIILFVITHQYLNDIAVEHVLDFERKIMAYFELAYPHILQNIRDNPVITDDLEKNLIKVIDEFKIGYLKQKSNPYKTSKA